MAKITSARRNALPAKDFAGPDRSYPVDTRNRAINAKGRADQQYEAGHISSSEYERIVTKANKVLKRGKK